MIDGSGQVVIAAPVGEERRLGRRSRPVRERERAEEPPGARGPGQGRIGRRLSIPWPDVAGGG
jgi:hypothetical protein